MTAVQTEKLVERINRFLDEIERGDVGAAIEAVEPLIHPEMEFTSLIGSEVEGHTFVGVPGIREWFEDFSDTFEVQYTERSITALDDDVVLGLFTNTLLGKGSQLEMSREIGTVWEFENGLIVRAVTYPTQEEARKAAEARHA
jgi:ketosteroid isomerase-like protein